MTRPRECQFVGTVIVAQVTRLVLSNQSLTKTTQEQLAILTGLCDGVQDSAVTHETDRKPYQARF